MISWHAHEKRRRLVARTRKAKRAIYAEYMFYYVYVLESISEWVLYIGFTTNLRRRLLEHNSGKGGSTTRKGGKWKIIYCEAYRDKNDVMGREKFLKSGSGRKYINKQLTNYFKK